MQLLVQFYDAKRKVKIYLCFFYGQFKIGRHHYAKLKMEMLFSLLWVKNTEYCIVWKLL